MTRATLSGARSQTFPSAMIDDDKDRCVSLISHARRAIDRPHLVRPGGSPDSFWSPSSWGSVASQSQSGRGVVLTGPAFFP